MKRELKQFNLNHPAAIGAGSRLEVPMGATTLCPSEKAVAVFDLDGTLVETDAANTAAYQRALLQCGRGTMAGWYGRVTSHLIRELETNISESEMNVIVRKKVEAYCHELWRTHLGPAANALKCVLVNRDLFDKVVLITNSAERRTLETLRFHQLSNCFDEIVCNAGVGNKYANYFNRHDTDPAACVVWENEAGQIQSALAAGVKQENIIKVV